MKFSEWSREQRNKALDERINTTLLIPREILGFINIEENLKGINLSNPFQIPPIIMDNTHLTEIILHSGDDEKGFWLRTFIRIYWEGGKVLFKKIDENNFEAKIQFD